jgi:hypothetical protein
VQEKELKSFLKLKKFEISKKKLKNKEKKF